MKWIAYISFLLLTFSATGQSFKAELKGDTMYIGQHNVIRLQFKDKFNAIPENFKFEIAEEEIIPKIEILDKKDPIKVDIQGTDSVLYEMQYKIIVFDSGYYAIPPFKATWNDTVKVSNPMLLTVKTVPVDTSKGIADIKGIYNVDYTFADRIEALKKWFKDNWILVTILSIAFIVIIILLILLARKNNNKEIVIVQRPAHELAFERLQILAEKNLWKQGKEKEYYSELTDIVRKYLEERYEVRAMEQTTSEIESSFRWVDITNTQKQEMIALLQLADLVKFAKEKPEDTDNESSINRVRKFILDTKFIPEGKKDKEEQKK